MRALLIAIIAGAATATSPAWAQTPLTDADYAAKAEALVQGFVKDGRFSGAVLVARDGKPVLREGFGLANREWDQAVTPDTEFRLGSITKQFTATAIMQLVEQGRVGLDDPISKYYAAAPKAWGKVTIRHLLTHRSGIPSYTAIDGFFRMQARIDRTPDEIIALTRDQPLQFEPGSKFEYDNTGYILLGYVIEKVSGQSYADYLKDHIFKPLGMDHTGYDVSGEILRRRASGYERSATGEISNAPYLSMTLPYAAGSLYSDVDDLLTWDQALYAGKPASAASLKDMMSDHGNHYGYGWSVDVVDGRRLWSHGGGINGFHTFIGRYPDQKLTVIVLSNIAQAPVEKIASQLVHLNFSEPLTPKAKAGEVAHAGAEAALRRVIGEIAAGKLDYTKMTPALADIIRTHEAEVVQLFKGFGQIQSVTFLGRGENDIDLFAVKFEHAATRWTISLDAEGRIQQLRFNPE